MENPILEKAVLLQSLGKIRLQEVETRLAELDAERAALSLLRRSLAARDRVKRRANNQRGEVAR